MAAIEKAFSYVKDALADGRWAESDRLPSLAGLAQACRVSRTSMWHALQELQAKSLVHTCRGGAIYAGKAGNARLIAPIRYRWQRTASAIEADLVASRISAGGALLATAELMTRYSVSHATLTKALRSLVAKKIIVEQGSRYSLPTGSTRRYQESIVFISEGSPDRPISIANSRSEQTVIALERESISLGFRFLPVGFMHKSSTAMLQLRAAIKQCGKPAGFVVNLWVSLVAEENNRWIDMILWLARLGVPIIILDQSSSLLPERLLSVRSNCRILRIAGTHTGLLVARYLAQQGHRCVGYVSPFFALDWARERAEGFRQSFLQAGFPGISVSLYTLNEIIDLNDLVLAMFNLSDKQLGQVFAESMSVQDLEIIISSTRRMRALKIHERMAFNKTAKTLQAQMRALVAGLNRDHDRVMHTTILEKCMSAARDATLAIYLPPLFEKALGNQQISAWVCSDDGTALAALGWLAKRKINVPEQLSIFGFDNIIASYENNLTTFDFNIGGIARHAVRLIATWPGFQNKKSMIEEIDGFIVERGTFSRL